MKRNGHVIAGADHITISEGEKNTSHRSSSLKTNMADYGSVEMEWIVI
jgi:hypothetical protein